MALADTLRNSTPRQRLVTGAAAAVVAIAGLFTGTQEGTVLHSYPDVVLGWGKGTACTGHTGPDVRPGQTFTPQQCADLLSADLRKTYDGILPCIGDIPMPDNELEAYLSFAFNDGAGTFCKSSIPAKLRAGNHAGACATLSLYRFVGNKDCALPQYEHVCGGLITRRAAERAMCEGALHVGP